jgi:hypothetical protein
MKYQLVRYHPDYPAKVEAESSDWKSLVPLSFRVTRWGTHPYKDVSWSYGECEYFIEEV